MIAGGGPGGHIYPALAIAREFVARDAKRRVVFVGTERGLEKTIVPKAGFPLEFISAAGLKGKNPIELAKSLIKLPLGFAQAFRLIGKHHPNAVLGVGGYSSGPVLAAAKLRGVKTIIHEQNAFPGLTNRILAKFVNAVAVAFEDAAPRLKRKDAVVTGNPIRAEFFSATRQPGNRATLLIFGGSQGSHILNTTMTESLLFLAHLKDRLDIVHQTGPREVEQVRSAYRTSALTTARSGGYLDPPLAERRTAA